jgi:hypothetical protein
MKKLNNVTLITVIGHNKPTPRENLALLDRILKTSSDQISFGKIKILSALEEEYSFEQENLEVHKIESMTGRDYNQFCIKNLHEYIDTDFALVFQTDGFIVNPDKWDDNFLNYDYIGAPWPDAQKSRVGNGGFSLRSQKFLNTVKNLDYIDNIGLSGGTCTPEDHLICRHYYEKLVASDIKFAPLDVAIKFSFEQRIAEFSEWNNSMSMGFHGLFQNGWETDNFRSKIKKQYNLS